MAPELETAKPKTEPVAGIHGKLKRPSSRQLALMLAASLVTGVTTYVVVHMLATPLPSGIGGSLTLLSGIFWVASLVAPQHSKSAVWLSAIAAWLTFLAGVCALA